MSHKKYSNFVYLLSCQFQNSSAGNREFFFYRQVFFHGVTVSSNIALTFGGSVNFGNFANDVIVASSTSSGSSSYSFGTINFGVINQTSQVFRCVKPVTIGYLKLTINGALGASQAINFNIELEYFEWQKKSIKY